MAPTYPQADKSTRPLNKTKYARRNFNILKQKIRNKQRDSGQTGKHADRQTDRKISN